MKITFTFEADTAHDMLKLQKVMELLNGMPTESEISIRGLKLPMVENNVVYKVRAIEALREHGAMGLADAKTMVEDLYKGETTTTIRIPADTEKRVRAELVELGFQL